jgi:hypothetical protein
MLGRQRESPFPALAASPRLETHRTLAAGNASAMANVDFITDKELRASIVSDLAELNTALEHGSFKSVHVLDGSVVEAILIDYLMAFDHVTKTKALEMDLGKCLASTTLTARVASRESVTGLPQSEC